MVITMNHYENVQRLTGMLSELIWISHKQGMESNYSTLMLTA